jgi:hypothetical protein
MKRNMNPFKGPKPLEYPEYFRPGMGTELVAPFLRSMVQILRPNRILEVGAGYTTPFLLEGLVNNERVLDDGNLNDKYFMDYKYDPKLVVIDDMSLGDLSEKPGMQVILDSQYVNFVAGIFQGQSKNLLESYGRFDFVWFDCGGINEYKSFLEEYWEICSGYLFFHFTYSNGKPNANLQAILSGITNEPFMIDLVEPHKNRQGSITVVKKQTP